MTVMEEFVENFKSEIFQKKITDLCEKWKCEKDISESQLRRFHQKISNESIFGNIVQSVIFKYNSYNYYRRWVNRTPPSLLFFFLYEYAQMYGREADDIEYMKFGNIFTYQIFYLHGWYFHKINGRDSFINIIKEEL